MDLDDDDAFSEGSFGPWLPPEDRLWRHPSEMAGSSPPASSSPPATSNAVPAAPRLPNRVWTIAVVAGILGALMATGIGAVTGEFGHRTTVFSQTKDVVGTTAANGNEAGSPTWPAIYNTLSPSIVAISTSGGDSNSVTSGFVWESDGANVYILTSSDSLQSASQVNVSFAGVSGTTQAKVMGADQMTDIAVLRVKADGHPKAAIGSVGDLRTGESLATMGSPLAAAQGNATALTTGAVNTLDCELQTTQAPTLLGVINMSTSSPPTPGSALVEPNGAVAGLTVGVQPSGSNQPGNTYAVPVDIADRIGGQIVSGNSATHPWIGVVNAQDLPTSTAASMNIPGGAEVLGVADGSPAEHMGIGNGDVITAIGNTPVTSAATLELTLDRAQPGQNVPIHYLHSGQALTKNTRIENRPSQVSS